MSDLTEKALEDAIQEIKKLERERGEVLSIKPTRAFREHIASADCWCGPELDYVDPDTGAKVYVHREQQ